MSKLKPEDFPDISAFFEAVEIQQQEEAERRAAEMVDELPDDWFLTGVESVRRSKPLDDIALDRIYWRDRVDYERGRLYALGDRRINFPFSVARVDLTKRRKRAI